MNAFDFQNIINADGITISLTGMLIVFCGLFLINIYIALLPKFLELLDSLLGRETASQEDKNVSSNAVAVEETLNQEERDISGMIGMVLQLELKRLHRQSPANA
jgi:Na+-transporting methylmalonyl-CoA/oxaloacetate decarboxylase gamma subunit